MYKTLTHFATVCPSCLAALNVKYSYVGSQVRCKHCGHGFRALVPEVPAAIKSWDEHGAGAERMMMHCPSCSATLSIRRAYAGSEVECKKCRHQFLVQKTEELPPLSLPEPPGQGLIDHFCRTPEPNGNAPPKPAVTNGQAEAEQSLRASFARECERLRGWFEDLEQDRAQVLSERNALAGQLEEARKQYDLLLAEAEHSKQESNHLETELARLRDCPPGLPPEEVETLKAESATLKAHVETLKAESAALKGQVETLKAESATLKTHVETLNDESMPLKAEIATLKTQIETLKAHVETLNDEIATLDAEIETLEIKGHTLRAERDSLHAQRESSDAERDTLRTELETMRGLVHSLQYERETQQAQLESALSQVQTLQHQRESLHVERQTLSAELETTRGLFQTLHAEL
ncbi:MAG: MJ0042-type zinc finger domain-containing protein, partial [Isosphaeraceae bacterium]